MIKNYLLIALRNFKKRTAFSLINILGLAIGMTACLLIFLYIRFERSYDSFHKDADRIYRLVCDIKTPTETIRADGPPWPVMVNLKAQFPEIEAGVRTVRNSLLVRKGDIKFQEENTLFADPDFFRIFDFPLIKGNPKTALQDPFNVVFSESAAKKYFGNENPIGQVVLMAQKAWPVKVTGIMKDLPENSQISADMIVSMSTETKNLNPGLEDYWDWSEYHPVCYLLLKPGTSANEFKRQLPAFMERTAGNLLKKQQTEASLSLERLQDVHLYSTRNGSKTMNSRLVNLFSFIALTILLIACINFVNLTTARSAERAREVGIRKVAGAIRFQLAGQFIGESVLYCILAFLLAVLFTTLLLPSFNLLAGKTISNGIFDHVGFLAALGAAALLIGVLAGLYPAFFLSSFQPSAVLKGRFSGGTKGIMLRKFLVILQFTLSTGFIIATLVVYKQLTFMREQDLGFNKEQVMVINTEGDPQRFAVQESLKNIPGVLSTTLSSNVPGTNNFTVGCQIQNAQGELQTANLDSYFVDWDYVNQYKLKLASGRSFSRDFPSDTTRAMLINETAARLFGYSSPEKAVGRRFQQFDREGQIIGVLKDFHFHSLQQQIEPLTMRIEPSVCHLMSVKVSTNHLEATINAISNRWQSIIPHRPLLYYFLDEYFDKQYRSEERFGKLFLYFTTLAIFIAAMGLFGLASYSTVQRAREIAVRKVMGASVGGIVHLLSRDFLQLVLVAFIIAAPLSWWFMRAWLQGFAYRTPIGWTVFGAAGLLAILMAALTTSLQAVKAAKANPVKTLRAE